MKVENKSAIEVLTEKNSSCLGAAFCTFTLDTQFLEEKVLPELLDIRSDPQEQANRFLEESRSRLREIPVVCIADGSVYRGGHRLPFDLLLINNRTFHAKLYLILFENYARLMIGSGNLTAQGFGGNSEIFQCLALNYDDPIHHYILSELDGFLKLIPNLVKDPGKQLYEFRIQLKRLCPALKDKKAPNDMAFIQSVSGKPLLEKFLRRIPDFERVTRVGLLAPFYEDDQTEFEASVLIQFRDFAKRKNKKSFKFEIGLPWEESSLGLKHDKTIDAEKHLGELWGLREGRVEELNVEYFVPTRFTSMKVFYEDRTGRSRSFDIDDFEAALEAGLTWPVGQISTHGPSGLLKEISNSCPKAAFWLFPNRRIEGGDVVYRPLHAKLYLITTKFRGKTRTYLLVGSPNASRKALIFKDNSGNIETAMIIRIEGDFGLSHFSSLLFKCPNKQIDLSDREFIPLRKNFARIINKAIFNARDENLRIEWNHEFNKTPFVLSYRGSQLYRGEMPKQKITVWPNFELHLTSCELTIRAEGEDYFVPIHVEDIQNLPANPFLAELELQELLAYFSGRINLESISLLRERAQKSEEVDAAMSFLFGGRFQPVDVFKAWFGMEKDLSEHGLTVGGFLVILEGPNGVNEIWERMKRVVEMGDMVPEEAWVYGLELHHTLSSIKFENTPVGRDKKKLLKNWLNSMRNDLIMMKPSSHEHTWVKDVAKFYGLK
jgi:hypothetical protein